MEEGEAEDQMVGLNEEGFFVDFVDGWLVPNAPERQQIKLRKDEKVKVPVLDSAFHSFLSPFQIFRLKIDIILLLKNESERPPGCPRESNQGIIYEENFRAFSSGSIFMLKFAFFMHYRQ